MPCTTKPSLRDAVTLRVLLPQRPGRRVARVGERRLAVGDQVLVQRREVLDREEHLATDLQQRGHVVAGQPSRDRPSIVRTLAVTSSPTRAVAAGGRPDQPAALVDQVQRQPVDLQLAQIAGLLDPLLPQLANRPLRPAVQLLAAERVVQAQQPLQMLDRRERGRRRPADLLGRRVGRAQRRELVLQRVRAPASWRSNSPSEIVGASST